jgi:hypothetical protein
MTEKNVVYVRGKAFTITEQKGKADLRRAKV